MRNSEIFDIAPSLAEFEREEGPPGRVGATALFTATQRRVLGYLYGQPDRTFHMQELFARTGTGNGAVQRELRRLEQAGLLCCHRERGRSLYRANARAADYAALTQLVQGSFGLAEPLREAFACLGPMLELMFVHEPVLFAACRNPPLETVLVARGCSLPMEALDRALELAQARLSRELADPLTLDAAKLARPGWHLGQVLEKARVWVFGHEAMLRAMTSGP